MRTLSSRERRIGYVTLAVIVGAGLDVWIIEPQLNRYAALQEQANSLQVSLTKMRANMLLKDQIEKRYAELRKMIRDSGSPSQEMAQFAQSLSNLYGPLGVQPKTVRPLPDVDEGYYRKYALQVEMDGNVLDIVKFLNAIAQSPETIRIDRVELVCKDRVDYLAASMIVTKVAALGEQGKKSSMRPEHENLRQASAMP